MDRRLPLADVGSTHSRAVVEALFVTLLWSSSYVLITVGLEAIPALTFAGLRYGVASLLLVGLFVARGGHRSLGSLSRRDLALFGLLGLSMYAVTQGAQFVALQYLQSATVSLLFQFTPVLVAGMAIPSLGERPTGRQIAGIAVLFAGTALYFYPLRFPGAELLGLGVMAVGVLGNATAAVLGRRFNRGDRFSALAVTVVTMSVGSAVLLSTGLAVQGLPRLSTTSWAIVVWLAVVNTALAFTLWNRSLTHLSAVESSVINNTMLIQVAALGWVFLGETLSALDVVGIGVVAVGALLVQLGGRG